MHIRFSWDVFFFLVVFYNADFDSKGLGLSPGIYILARMSGEGDTGGSRRTLREKLPPSNPAV